MATDDNKVGKWNLGYGSNMNVKHITEKKGVKILGEAKLCGYSQNQLGQSFAYMPIHAIFFGGGVTIF